MKYNDLWKMERGGFAEADEMEEVARRRKAELA